MASVGRLRRRMHGGRTPKVVRHILKLDHAFRRLQNVGRTRAGVISMSPTGDTVQYVLQIMYTDSNNAAEYEALLHGLRIAISMGIQCLEVRGDSNLVISQINGDFDAKDPKMAAYRNVVLKMSARFEGLEFHHIARENNQAADVLARIGAKRDVVPP